MQGGRLHAIYRSSAVENRKARPAFYDKDLALRTFLDAFAEAGGSDLIFINDGDGLPPGRIQTMESVGSVVTLPGVGNSRSLRVALGVLEAQPWDGEDLVYLVEDDYLHTADSLTLMRRAATVIAAASFFLVYDHPDHYSTPAHGRYRRRHRDAAWYVDGVAWRAVRTGTMTFGARIAALRQVAALYWLVTGRPVPDGPTAWASITSGRVGIVPTAMRFSGNMRLRSVVKAAACTFVPSFQERYFLVAPHAPMATHMELPWLAPGRDWEAFAAEVST